MDSKMSDTDIWKLALTEGYVILTKDSDFYMRSMVSKQKPKVVYFKLGNMRLTDLENYFEAYWLQILRALENNSLVIARIDRIDIMV